jgi:hypothetical protein
MADSDPCYREWDDDPGDPGWWCINDHTGCFYNDGHNTCSHEGDRASPLEDTDGIRELRSLLKTIEEKKK